MKKKLKKLENQVLKFLNKKVSVVTVLWLLIGLLLIVKVAFLAKPKYRYIDMDNNHGKSIHCYETDTEMFCNADIKVKQYYKD